MSHCAICSPTTPACPDMLSSSAQPNTPPALFRACLELPLEAEPGTRAEYSDPGFILLGKALEVLTARSTWLLWARREIFEPLGMAPTGFCPPQLARAAIPPTEEDTTFRIAAFRAKFRTRTHGC